MTRTSRIRRYKVPSTISEAILLCLEVALAKYNRTPKRIAELMLVKLDTLYKWISEQRIPVNMIGPFENACGATYLTQYLCAQAHLLAIEIPNGRKVDQNDMLALQENFAKAVALLIQFKNGEAEAAETAAHLQGLMCDVGWHKANVERAGAPELKLFPES